MIRRLLQVSLVQELLGQNDSITDTTSGDTDTLNLSGNANYDHTGVGGNGVSGFEIVNLDLAKQSGSTLLFTNLTNDVEQLNVEVSSTVDVVGITVAGETSLTVPVTLVVRLAPRM